MSYYLYKSQRNSEEMKQQWIGPDAQTLCRSFTLFTSSKLSQHLIVISGRKCVVVLAIFTSADISLEQS